MRAAVLLLAIVASGCADPFADSCGGPSIFSQEGFELRLGGTGDVLTIAPGESASIPVCAVRYRFFDDPIDVTVVGLPPGITTDGATIGKGKYSTALKFHADLSVQLPAPRKLDLSGIAGTFVSGLELLVQVRGPAGMRDRSFGEDGEVIGSLASPAAASRVVAVVDAGAHLLVAGNSRESADRQEADAIWYDWRGTIASGQSVALRLPGTHFQAAEVERSWDPSVRRLLLVTAGPDARLLDYGVSDFHLLDSRPAASVRRIAATADQDEYAIVGASDGTTLVRMARAGNVVERFDFGSSVFPSAIAAGIAGDAWTLTTGSEPGLWRIPFDGPPQALAGVVPDGARRIFVNAAGEIHLTGALPAGGGYLLRYDASGNVDREFGIAGMLASSRYRPEVVLPDDDGSLIVLSSYGSRCSLVRLDRIGRNPLAIDLEFPCGRTHFAQITGDHRLIVAGESGNSFLLRRYWL